MRLENLVSKHILKKKMDTETCILTRRSIRKFKKVGVDMEKIGKIIEAGRAAPSSGNLQNWLFILVDDPGKKKAITEACFGQDWMQTAPLLIVVCAKPTEAQRFYGIRGERLYTIQNCAAAAENMLLMAHDQGLGACWVGAFDEEKVRDIIGLFKEGRPQIILAVGYADEDPLAPLKLKFDNVAYWNKWWGRIKDINVFMGYNTAAKIRRLVDAGKSALEKARKKIQK